MLRAVSLLLLSTGCSGLMFHSTAVTKQWDTWAFVENGTWYAYYLITEVSYGEGFGVATSSDGVHWTDHGYVWHGPAWVKYKRWQGTSSVWRAADFNTTGRYLINYSECYPEGNQTITFAESFDLIHWSRPAPYNTTYFNIDPSKGYTGAMGGGRWDTIYSIPAPGPGQQNLRDGYPRYGYWTASPSELINQTFGFGITHDGLQWEALPSPPMIDAPQGGGELGAVEYIPFRNGSGGAYYAMIGYGWPRTMLTYYAPTPAGPFSRAQKNVNLVNGSCYYARFFRGPNMEVLVTHQSWTHAGTHFAYIAPYKEATLDDEGQLYLTYWKGNDAMKGAKLPLVPNASSPRFYAGGVNVSKGAVMEATFVRPAADANPSTWPGFLMEYADTPGALCVVLQPDGMVAIGDFDDNLPFNYTPSAAQLPTKGSDWTFGGGAAAAASRLSNTTEPDIRSGNPGGTGFAYLAQ